MKQIILTTIISLLLIVACSKEENEPVFDVLLIGSSFTNGYSLMLQEIVFNSGDSINRLTSSIGGGTIKRHLIDAKTLQFISENELDYVMIQESGYNASFTHEEFQESTIPYLKTLIDTIKYYSPDARIGLYMSHAYKTGNTGKCEKDSLICDYKGMQKRIIQNYTAIAEKFNLEVAPVGHYWQKFNNENPKIKLWSSDNIHAAPIGNYLTASIIFETIYNHKPEIILYPLYSDSSEMKTIYDFILNVELDSYEWE